MGYRNAPVLNLERIRAIHDETRRVQELLHSVLATPETFGSLGNNGEIDGAIAPEVQEPAVAELVVAAPPRDEAGASCDCDSRLESVPERYRTFCRLVVAKSSWQRTDLSVVARQNGLMLNAACEALNEWSTDVMCDWLLEEVDDLIVVHTQLLESS